MSVTGKSIGKRCTVSDILIREMTEEDLPQAILIEQSCIADPWSERVYREEFSHQGEYIWLFVALLNEDQEGNGWLHDVTEGGNVSDSMAGNSAYDVSSSGNGKGAGRIVGTISLTRMGDDGEIGNVAVLPEYRRRGIAEQMLRYVLEYGERESGMRDFTLEVRDSNQAAIRLYEKCGFCTEGIRPHMYRNPAEDARIMWLRDDACSME